MNHKNYQNQKTLSKLKLTQFPSKISKLFIQLSSWILCKSSKYFPNLFARFYAQNRNNNKNWNWLSFRILFYSFSWSLVTQPVPTTYIGRISFPWDNSVGLMFETWLNWKGQFSGLSFQMKIFHSFMSLS
jgi:hypothetical protein